MSERAYGRLLDKCEKLEAENERLQGLYNSATDQAVRYADEIERLTVLAQSNDDITWRLTTALLGVQESTDLDDAHGIARRAVENKP